MNFFRKLFPKLYKPTFSWLETDEANEYHIMRDDDWFALIKFNGRMPVKTQIMHLDFLIKKLNKIYYKIVNHNLVV